MAYTPTTWLDWLVQYPDRFRITDNGDGTVTIAPEPDTIYEAGTPANAANLNKIEQGIADAAATADAALPKSGGDVSGGVSISGFVMGNSTDPVADLATIPDLRHYQGILNNVTGYPSAYGSIIGYKRSSNAHAFSWQIFQGYNTNVLHYRKGDGSNGWTAWQQLITSAGGQTVNGGIAFSKGETTAYNGSATDGQVMVGSTIFVQQTGGSNAAVAQMVFQPRSGYGYNRIVSSGGSAPYMTFITNNAERMRIASDGTVTVGGNEVWHRGDLRWNVDHLEYNDAGTWKAVGGVKNIQRGSVASTVGPVNVTISAVNMAKASVNIPGSTNGSDSKGRLTSSTNIEILTDNGGDTIPWEIIEYH